MELIFILFIILAPISFLTLLEIMVLKESCEKTLKYLKPAHGLPANPRLGLKSLKAICMPYMGI